MIAGFTPRRAQGRRPHLVAVVAFDGVVLGDLSTACEVFGLAKRKDGRPAYEVRVCSESLDVESMHVALRVRWRLSSLAQADTVIVPGVNDLTRPVPTSVLRAIRRAAGWRLRRGVDLHRRVRAGGHRPPRRPPRRDALAGRRRSCPSSSFDRSRRKVLYVDTAAF